MKRLNNMLEQAAAGNFKPDQIDESVLSAIEFKLAAYLSNVELQLSSIKDEKNKIKTLIADISHQTKTPISNIMLYSELLEEQNLDETSLGYAKALNSQTKKLNFLIISLIKMSRLETGILNLHPQTNSLSLLIEEAYTQLSPKAAAKGLKFDIVYSHENIQNSDIIAVFDAKWTLEALCNIIDNAVKYTNTGGITIKVSVYTVFSRIDIIDTGIGIEEEQAQIFTRFYRSPKTAKQEGVGIGLYLAREIIVRESGYIKLSSTPGKGAEFSVFLPNEMNSL